MKNKRFNLMVLVVAGLTAGLMIGCADSGGWFGMPTKGPQEFSPATSQTPKTVAAPTPAEPSVATPRPEVVAESNTAENSTREVEVTRQVNDQVERLKKAYDQSQQARKNDVTITSVTPVDDSHSLAAKLSQKPMARPPQPTITPIKPAADKSNQNSKPVPQTPKESKEFKESKNVKILNVESVEAKIKTPPAPKSSAPAVGVADQPQPVQTVNVPALPLAAQPANQSIKLEVPDVGDPGVAMDQLLTKLEKKLQERPGDTATQVKLRLVYAVLGQWQQALKDSGGKDATNGELARDLVALIRVFDNPEMPPAQQANEALNLLDRLQDLLRRQADLKVSNMQLCREVISFGCYKAMPGEYFIAGKTLPVIVYLELDNFTSKKLGEENYQTLLALTMEIVSESGKVCWRQHDDKIEDTANKQRRDFYIARLINLPAALPAGKLGLKVTVEDLNGNKVAQRNLPFQLRTDR